LDGNRCDDRKFLDLMRTALVAIRAIVIRSHNVGTYFDIFDDIIKVKTFEDFKTLRDSFFKVLNEAKVVINVSIGTAYKTQMTENYLLKPENVKSAFISNTNATSILLYAFSLINYDYTTNTRTIDSIIDNDTVYKNILSIICFIYNSDSVPDGNNFVQFETVNFVGCDPSGNNLITLSCQRDTPVHFNNYFKDLDRSSKEFLLSMMRRYGLIETKAINQLQNEIKPSDHTSKNTVDDYGESACRSLTFSSMGALVGIAMIIYPFVSFSENSLMPAITQKLKYISAFTALEVFGLAIAIVGAIFFVRTIINLNSVPEGTNEQEGTAITYDPAAAQTQLEETFVSDDYKKGIE
jgi:hypothetical protein